MTCELCGEPCHGQRCSGCETIVANEKLAPTGVEQTGNDQQKRWVCTECGVEYSDAGWDGCPECGSKRRRAAPEEVSA
jgi:hypothetical protein